MTTPAPPATPDGAAPDGAALAAAAAAGGLDVLASACWPETAADIDATPVAGFIESAFSPLIAEVTGRVLRRRAQSRPVQSRLTQSRLTQSDPEPAADDAVPAPVAEDGTVTAIVLVTALGDVTSAVRVAASVDAGKRVAPLLFFQSVPNAVAGYLAARWHLTGPVVCVSATSAAVEVAALLLEDADADEALIVSTDLEMTDGTGDRAAAIVVTSPAGSTRYRFQGAA